MRAARIKHNARNTQSIQTNTMRGADDGDDGDERNPHTENHLATACVSVAAYVVVDSCTACMIRMVSESERFRKNWIPNKRLFNNTGFYD